jgi:hypothetical protein
VRDDRLPSKQAARRAPSNSAVASAAWKTPPPVTPSAGATGTRLSLRPLIFRGRDFQAQLGRIAPRGRESVSTSLRGALATKQSTLSLWGKMDCFAPLAMTLGALKNELHLRHSGMRRLAQASDVQLHIGESILPVVVMDSGLARSLSSGAHSRDPLARPGMTSS